MRAAIYGRVSTDKQEKEHTIGSQLEALRAYAAKNQMEIVGEFADEGYSGARLDRPGLDRMRDSAQRGGFDVLLAYCADRLARKFVLQALILDELERFGVKVIFLEGGSPDDPLSKLMHQITGAVAEFERAKIVERNRRGKLYRARCGEIVSGCAPYGYIKIPRRDGVPAHLEINEAEAAVVRRIFHAYVVRDLTLRQVARELTLDRVPTRRDSGQWNWSSVDRILRNEVYVGTCYYNRAQCIPLEGGYGEKRQRYKPTLRPKEEWIAISVPPIVDLNTFHRAASRARDKSMFSPRNLRECAYLLRRLVRCGHCGGGCTAVAGGQRDAEGCYTRHYYKCWRTTSGFLSQERCTQRYIRAEALDEMVWEDVVAKLKDPRLILEAYEERRTRRIESDSTDLPRKLEAQIKFANLEVSRLLDAYQQGAVELPELQKRRRLVDAKLDSLNREKELLATNTAERQRDEGIRESLQAFAGLVLKNVEHMSFENKQKLVRLVVDKVVVADWRVDVHYKIPLPKPPDPAPGGKVSTKLNLCSARQRFPAVLEERLVAFACVQVAGFDLG